MGAIIPWSQDTSLSFISINSTVTIYLILASILRLGVFPLQHHNLKYLTQQRELSTTLRLVTAASSLILVVRVANIGVTGAITPYILGFTALTGLLAGIQWFISSDEVKGQFYWVLGTAALAIASGVLNLHSASIAWSMVCLLSGGLIFSMSLRHKNLAPVAFLGIYALSTLPFSPSWIGSDLFIYSDSLSKYINTTNILFNFHHTFTYPYPTSRWLHPAYSTRNPPIGRANGISYRALGLVSIPYWNYLRIADPFSNWYNAFPKTG